MKREIYVFMDTVSRGFGEPFTMANDAELRRQFEHMVKDSAIPAYAIRDTVVVHLGTFEPNADHPHIVPDAVPFTVLRGDSFNVDEIRRQISSVDASTSELCSD